MKIKLTKGELKRQRDSLRQYERYLPTLQLKKQQLQIEIAHQQAYREEKEREYSVKRKLALSWSALLCEDGLKKAWLLPRQVIRSTKNIAGVDIPVFMRLEFVAAEYDLFLTPLWVDAGLEALRGLVTAQEELRTIREGVEILRHELRITSQRVNLFEKVKIPEAKEAIRLIKIYIGDQMTNAVGRSKITKAKIEEMSLVPIAS